MLCGWCRSVLRTTTSRRRFCSRKCRQSAFRLRRRSSRSAGPSASSGAFHYADPPYPGTSSKYYRDEPSFAGEVDFPALIASLAAAHDRGESLGWALSTSARSLRELLPLCPPWDCRCGLCNVGIRRGEPVLKISIPTLKRLLLRCPVCVGPAPPDLPELVERPAEIQGMQPLRVAAKGLEAVLDFKARAAGA